MQTIQRVGIIGRGAIGALYGSLLQQGGVSELIFIADEQRRERYAREPAERVHHDARGTPEDLLGVEDVVDLLVCRCTHAPAPLPQRHYQ